MSVFVNLNKAGTTHKYLRLSTLDGITRHPTKSRMGLELGGTPVILTVGGENDGRPLVDGVLKANQTVRISLGTVDPQKFHAMVEPNPMLSESCIVGGPRLIEPGDAEEITLTLRSFRQLDLSLVRYWVRIYLVD